MAGRLYDPELGRFLGPDPYVADMASGQDWNAYAYVGGRPASRTDPTGRIRAGPMCNLPGVICMTGGDAGGALSAAPSRGWAGLFGVDVSVDWIPIYSYEGPGSADIGPGLWFATYHPVLIWNVWGLYYEATAHGAAERQAADEPMSRPKFTPEATWYRRSRSSSGDISFCPLLRGGGSIGTRQCPLQSAMRRHARCRMSWTQ